MIRPTWWPPSSDDTPAAAVESLDDDVMGHHGHHHDDHDDHDRHDGHHITTQTKARLATLRHVGQPEILPASPLPALVPNLPGRHQPTARPAPIVWRASTLDDGPSVGRFSRWVKAFWGSNLGRCHETENRYDKTFRVDRFCGFDITEIHPAWTPRAITILECTMQQNGGGDWITLRDLAQRVGMSTTAVYQWARRGRLPAIKRGGRIYFNPAVAIKTLVRPIGQVGPTDDK
jgi:hypothetical protein